LSGATHRIDGDFIEAGSWAVAAAVTGGEVEVRGARALDMEPIVAVLSRFGVRTELEEGCLRVLESALEGAGRRGSSSGCVASGPPSSARAEGGSAADPPKHVADGGRRQAA